MKLASWNVNGIRAAAKKGLLEWIKNSQVDIACFQETKADEEIVATVLKDFSKRTLIASSAEKKGYSGVATLTKPKFSPTKIETKLGIKKFDCEGRMILTEFENFFLINAYYPNGQRDHGRVPYKLEFSQKVLELAKEQMKKLRKPALLCGDFNTAHTADDLANPKTNTKTTGFLPKERAWLDHLESEGFIDCFRASTPEGNGHYTWWTYRGDCRERNIGWRIDYFYMHKDLKPYFKKCYHAPETLGSDHCPIIAEFKFS